MSVPMGPKSLRPFRPYRVHFRSVRSKAKAAAPANGRRPRRAFPLSVLAVLGLAGCAGSLQKDYVAADRQTFESFGPVVARDVAAGYADTGYVYQSWQSRLVKAERATSQPSK